MTNPIVRGLRRWAVRRRQFDGTSGTLDALYARPDPWRLNQREHGRFEATNALIAAHCSPVASILEIGCGEGYQTRYFRALADTVVGIDISTVALARARAAVPRATFLAGTLADLRPQLPQPRFDLATLCEVLVYGDRPQDLLASAQGCARQVLVTSFVPQAGPLALLCTGAGWQALPEVRAAGRGWRVWRWTDPEEDRRVAAAP